jgi:hypothetical protein
MDTANRSAKVGRSLIVLVVTALCGLLSVSSWATTIIVTSTFDSGAGSLRAALASAADGDTIDASSVTGTILLTNGELLVTNSVNIIGPGPNLLAVDGSTASRVFHVNTNATVAISGLTVTNGLANGAFPENSGGGIYNEGGTLTISNVVLNGNSGGSCGGIYNDGRVRHASLTVIDSVILGNRGGLTSFAGGGGINSEGSSGGSVMLTVVNSTLSGNSANLGGGVCNNGFAGSATMTLSNCIISGNAATTDQGGGIYNTGVYGGASAKIVNCTVSRNSASDAGGIFNYGYSGSATVTVVNTTLSGNSGGYYGGGIYNDGWHGTATLVVANSTLSDNSAIHGSGIYNEVGTVRIGNTILNAGPPGITVDSPGVPVISLGYNLSSDNGGGFLTATGDLINTNPKLGPLQDNGGATKTHALLPGSPAIDAGDPTFTSPPDFDQRGLGFPRVVNGRIDIGAFEFTPDLLITAAERTGNDLRLTFAVALLGKNYELQSRTNLTFGSWEILPGNIPGNGGTAQATVTSAFGVPQQFFRIHQLP